MSILSRIDQLRQRRAPQLAVALLRIFLGFAFVPSGLKKLLGEPFTDPLLTGPFHDFLDAFYATGLFYPAVGLLQLLSAFLLMTQRFALLGACLMFPLLTAIFIFCWSTSVIPTATVVTLMMLGLTGLLVWDAHALSRILSPERNTLPSVLAPRVQWSLWGWGGAAVFTLYLLSCTIAGGIYRPRGMEWDEPAFYVFPLLLVLVLVIWRLDLKRSR